MKKSILIFIIAIAIFSCNRPKNEKNVSPKSIKVFSIFIDGSNNKWFGSEKGIYCYTGEKWLNYTKDDDLPDNIINDLIAANSNINQTLWAATPKGLSGISVNNHLVENVEVYDTNNSSLRSDMINVLSMDSYKNLWIGTSHGIVLHKNNIWIDSLSFYIKNQNISSIAFRDDEIFIGTLGSYLYRGKFNNQTDAITGASQMMAGFNGDLTTDTIYCLLVDNEKNIWYGSSKGLTKHVGYNSKEGFTYFFENEKVFSVFQSADLKIWVGKENGTSVFDGTNWTNYSSSEGLNCAIVYDIAEDINNTIWIATDNGVYKFTDGIITAFE